MLGNFFLLERDLRCFCRSAIPASVGLDFDLFASNATSMLCAVSMMSGKKICDLSQITERPPICNSRRKLRQITECPPICDSRWKLSQITECPPICEGRRKLTHNWMSFIM